MKIQYNQLFTKISIAFEFVQRNINFVNPKPIIFYTDKINNLCCHTKHLAMTSLLSKVYFATELLKYKAYRVLLSLQAVMFHALFVSCSSWLHN